MKQLFTLIALMAFLMHAKAQPCDSIKITIESSDTNFCYGDVVTLKAKVENTSKKVKYSWSNGSDSSSTWFIAKNNTTITLNSTVYRCFGTYTDKQEITVENINNSLLYEYYGKTRAQYSYKLNTGEKMEISVRKKNSPNDTSFAILSRSIVFKIPGTYGVYFKTTGPRCTKIDSFITTVNEADFENNWRDTLPLDYVYIPNVIVQTANFYTNSYFKPTGYLSSYSISIFSRRGNRVFYCDEPKCFWDGKDGKGEFVMEGVYVYVIHAINIVGEEKKYTGTLTVIH